MSLRSVIEAVYSPKLLELLEKIGKSAEAKGLKAYAVGGFVRDLLLRQPNFDIDIMVEGDAIPFAASVAQELNAECQLIERFRTAHIYLPDLTIDFSSARKETYPSPGALPEISFSNIRDDLFRRDFTVNAIALSITQDSQYELVDFFNGAKDLEKQQIKVLHPNSFIDDPTRLFRAIRFADRFGFSIEYLTQQLFDNAVNSGTLATISPKRVAAEINKCFHEKYPYRLITKILSEGLLKYYHYSLTPNLRPPIAFSTVRPTVTRFSRFYKELSEEAVFWALFLSKISLRDSQNLVINSGLPHSIVNKITSALADNMNISSQLDQAKDNTDIHKILKKSLPESLVFMFLASTDFKRKGKITTFIEQLKDIKPLVSSNQLMEIGVKPGPLIGKIFEEITTKRLINNNITLEDELEIVRRIQNI